MRKIRNVQNNYKLICDLIDSSEVDENEKYLSIQKIILENKNVMTIKSEIDGATILHKAAQSNLVDLVKLILSFGADVNTADSYQNTALHYAAKQGLDNMILCLSFHGVDLNRQNISGETALHIAVKGAHRKCIKNLLTVKNPVNESILNADGLTAKSLINDLEDEYLKMGVAESFTYAYDLLGSVCLPTPFHVAVINRQYQTVKSLLHLGASINESNSHGFTALHLAAMNGDHIMVALLCIDANIDINALNENKETALHLSVRYKHPACVKALVTAKKPIKKSITNSFNYTAEFLVNNLEALNEKVIMLESLSTTRTQRNDNDLLNFELIRNKSIGTDLRDKFKNLKLRDPKCYVVSVANQKEAAIFRLTQNYSDERRKSIRLYNKTISLKYDDIMRGNIEKIQYYLLNKGDPNLVIDFNQKQVKLIEVALASQNDLMFVELLKQGASLDGIDKKVIHASSNIISRAEELLALDFDKIKLIFDKNIDQQSQNMEELILNKINLLDEKDVNDDFLKINITIPLDQLMYKICLSKIMDSHLSFHNIHSVAQGLLGNFMLPDILDSIIRILPNLNLFHRFTGYVLVKEIFLMSQDFGFNLEMYDAHVATLIKACQDSDVSENIEMISKYIYELNSNPICVSYMKLRDLQLMYPNPNLEKIDDKLAEASQADMKKLNSIAIDISKELVNLNGRLFKLCDLSEYKRNFGKMNVELNLGSCLPFHQYLNNSLVCFIQISILNRKTHDERVNIMTLFILIAKECMSNPIIINLNAVGCIMTALESDCISRLQLLDNKVLAIYKELKKIINPLNNFSMYKRFQTAYINILPWLVLTSKNFTFMNEFELSPDILSAYGELFKPYIALRKLPIHFQSDKTNLLYQLTHIVLLSDDELDDLSFIVKPDIPLLSNNVNFTKVNSILEKQMHCKIPLMVQYKKKIYIENEALNKLKEWLDLVDSAKVSIKDKNEFYTKCDKYINVVVSANDNPQINNDGANLRLFNDRPTKKKSFRNIHLHKTDVNLSEESQKLK